MHHCCWRCRYYWVVGFLYMALHICQEIVRRNILRKMRSVINQEIEYYLGQCGSSPCHYVSSPHLLETPLYQKKRVEFPTHSGVESPWGPNKVSFEDEAAGWCSCVQRGPLSWASIFPRVTPIHGPGLLVRRHRAPNTRFCILLLKRTAPGPCLPLEVGKLGFGPKAMSGQ